MLVSRVVGSDYRFYPNHVHLLDLFGEHAHRHPQFEHRATKNDIRDSKLTLDSSPRSSNTSHPYISARLPSSLLQKCSVDLTVSFTTTLLPSQAQCQKYRLLVPPNHILFRKQLITAYRRHCCSVVVGFLLGGRRTEVCLLRGTGP